MAEPDRDVFLGQLDGRLESLEGRFDGLETGMNNGFTAVHRRLDELFAAENRRKGAFGVVKALVSGGTLAALWEAGKSFFGGHHP